MTINKLILDSKTTKKKNFNQICQQNKFCMNIFYYFHHLILKFVSGYPPHPHQLVVMIISQCHTPTSMRAETKARIEMMAEEFGTRVIKKGTWTLVLKCTFIVSKVFLDHLNCPHCCSLPNLTVTNSLSDPNSLLCLQFLKTSANHSPLRARVDVQ